MDHNDIRHKLSEYIDGAVTPQERAAIDEHLKTCTTCSDALAELRKTIEQVKQIEEVEAPAWMTRKIMANVREEREKRSGILNILLNYFVIGRAIRVAAVLFLTVTVYYIYSSMHPAEKYTEAPMDRLAKQEAPDELRDAARRKAADVPAGQEKKVAQEPGYKSLDMKYEYEKPAPPKPAETPAAEAPVKSAAPLPEKNEISREVRPAVPKSAAPSMMAEQAAPAAGISGKAKSFVADDRTHPMELASKSLRQRDELEPPELSFTSARPTMAARPATYLKLGAYQVDLEKTTLNEVVKKIGGGMLQHRGEAGGSLYWLCYESHSYRLWLLSSELGGPEHTITGFHAKRLSPGEALSKHCQMLPQKMQSAKIDRKIWLGMTDGEIHSRLGAPSQRKQDILEYYYLGQIRIPNTSGFGDEMNLLKIFMQKNLVTEIQASKASTY